jgi:hypothetical protein
MIHIVRLVTVHPVFVHFTIGALPIVVLSYAMAAWLGSENWSFTADVAAGVTALLTLLTMAFGLVSNAYVGWPGGLGFWRYLHMGLGVATTLLILLLAGTRLALRQRGQVVAGSGALGLAILVAIMAGAAGWVGGEILTYTAGMAVQAAGQGALSPVPGGTHEPVDLIDSMGEARGDWGAISSDLARMLVRRPTDSDYADIARRAARLQQIAAWITANGIKSLPRPNALVIEHEHEHGEDPPPGPGPEDQSSTQTAIRLVQKHAGPEIRPGSAQAASTPKTRAQHLVKMADILQQRSRALQDAARRKDIVEVARVAGAISEECADCHQDLRWHARD